jgi:hypothetical protein
MSTVVSATIQFDRDTALEVTAYAGAQGVGPFVGIRSSDTGSSVSVVLRDHVGIERLRRALEEAEAKLTAIEAHEAAKEQAS